MAEAIGLTASIIAIVQIAGVITKACKSFIDGVEDYPKDLRRIYVEVSSLVVVFKGLELLDPADRIDSEVLATILGPDGPVQGCQEALKRLEKLLSSNSVQSSDGPRTKKQRLQVSLAGLAWPLKAGTAKKILEEIMQHKTTINLALGGEVLQGVKNVQQTVNEIRHDISQALKRQVCEWFRQTNPSFLHTAATELYEPGTGDWVMRCDEWQRWLQLNLRCIWIHGIPGAGKTILASHLIEELKAHCAQQLNNNVLAIYYYCYHGHNQDEAKPLVRWLISELCHRTGLITQKAYSMFEQGHVPSLTELLDCLSSLLEVCTLKGVFLVIDALDESQDRHNLLRTVRDLASDTRFCKIHILATSREYIDIEETMLPISRALSMSDIESVQADIRTYITAKVSSEQKFQSWAPTLRVEIEDALNAGAKGMFRWVVCQLDILRRLNNPGRVREAIKSLPATLDETYERIFSMIAEEERFLVRHALHWLILNDLILGDLKTRANYFATQELFLSANELRYACSVMDMAEGHCYGPFDVVTLKESCGCLIRFLPVQDSQMSLERATIAHYTVREYLETERSSTQNASFFRVKPGSSLIQLLDTMFRTLTTTAATPEVQAEAQNSCMHSKMQTHCSLLLFLILSALYRNHSILATNAEAESLLLEYLIPSQPNSAHFSDALNEITGSKFGDGTTLIMRLEKMDCLVPGPSLLILLEITFSMLKWPTPPQDPTLSLVLNLLTLAHRYEYDCWSWSVAEKLIKNDKHLLSTTLTITAPVVFPFYPWSKDPPPGLGQPLREVGTRPVTGTNPEVFAQPLREFETGPITGTIPEVFAQLGNNCVLGRLCKSFPGEIDIKSVLLYSIPMHRLLHKLGPDFHEMYGGLCSEPYEDMCVIASLIEDFNQQIRSNPSYITQLQLAVAVGDLRIIHSLLKSGIDPNELGDIESQPWKDDSSLFRCNRLHHHSPLNIARNRELYLHQDPMSDKEWEKLTASMQKVLLKYGARDFIRDEVQEEISPSK
ncbi:hypothetical protein QBC43DRAFT_231228 [Cladorrhinum sp. PSN259]|nr:hypothetical protein QBC43DRAFT_231228 [Cladorrhinum sp. PSN259]